MAKEKVESTEVKSQKVIFRRAAKITAKIQKTADMKVGEVFRGKYVSFTERPWLDKTTGEEKIIPQYNFEDLENGERLVLLGDAGLKNAMISAAVEPGDRIEIEKHEQVELTAGRRANQYDIYQLSAN